MLRRLIFELVQRTALKWRQNACSFTWFLRCQEFKQRYPEILNEFNNHGFCVVTLSSCRLMTFQAERDTKQCLGKVFASQRSHVHKFRASIKMIIVKGWIDSFDFRSSTIKECLCDLAYVKNRVQTKMLTDEIKLRPIDTWHDTGFLEERHSRPTLLSGLSHEIRINVMSTSLSRCVVKIHNSKGEKQLSNRIESLFWEHLIVVSSKQSIDRSLMISSEHEMHSRMYLQVGEWVMWVSDDVSLKYYTYRNLVKHKSLHEISKLFQHTTFMRFEDGDVTVIDVTKHKLIDSNILA